MYVKSVLFAATATLSGIVQAQGAFDFSRIPGISAEPTVQIDLNPMMIGFVSEAARATDPQAADVLAGIRGIQVLVYELGETSQPLLSFIDTASGALENDGWQRAVYVQEGDEKVRIYMKFDASEMAGLTVMVADSGGEAVFVNVDGAINPAMLGRIAGQLGMGGMLGVLGEAAAGSGAGGSGTSSAQR
jgi:hypothetical protein